jgi:hypothetical protein
MQSMPSDFTIAEGPNAHPTGHHIAFSLQVFESYQYTRSFKANLIYHQVDHLQLTGSLGKLGHGNQESTNRQGDARTLLH